MFAVIKTGGKQYVVAPDKKIRIEKVIGEPGSSVVFDNVLLFSDGSKTLVGTPKLEGASVTGEVLQQGRGEKKIVFKYKSKTRQRTKKGHRQSFTEIKVVSMSA